MFIGVDFDNTLVQYDELFHRCACEQRLIPPETPVSKAAVRAYLWSLPDGNTPWTELQGIVYGSRMDEARPCPGALEFLASCRTQGIRVAIVSHKVEFPALGPPVNLRQAAMRWIDRHIPYGTASGGLKHSDVYFEATREAKIERIRQLGCTHFIDDLPEVLTDTAFPQGVGRILYVRDEHTVPPTEPTLRVMTDWDDLAAYFANLR